MPTAADHESFREITNSLKVLYDLTARIDERVLHLQRELERFSGLGTRVALLETTGLAKKVEELSQKLSCLEKKISGLDVFRTASEQRWTRLADLAFKLIVGVVVAWVVWRLGLKD